MATRYKIRFERDAESDLRDLWTYIARESPARADRFVLDLVGRCERLADFPGVGRPLSGARPNVKVVSYRRRATIAYELKGDVLLVRRILYKGRDQAALLLLLDD